MAPGGLTGAWRGRYSRFLKGLGEQEPARKGCIFFNGKDL